MNKEEERRIYGLIKNVIAPESQEKQATKDFFENLSNAIEIKKLGYNLKDLKEEWENIVNPNYSEMIKNLVYSPLQLLLYKSAYIAKVDADKDFPFLFGTIANLIFILLFNEYGKVWGDEDISLLEKIRKILQEIFRLREIKEEGEHLSIEIIINKEFLKNTPQSTDNQGLEIKKLSQIFGRGVALNKLTYFEDITKVQGEPISVFREHTGAPQNLLYKLGERKGESLKHVPHDSVSVSLRRDKNITLSNDQGPLLEFYDGGWHIIDNEATEYLMDYTLSEYYNCTPLPDVCYYVLNLAYHMATHWHSGIIAIIASDNEEKVNNDLEEQKSWSKESKIITLRTLKKGINNDDETINEINITNINEKGAVERGIGRLLLTNVIQDGATLFGSNGVFHSSGRIVRELGNVGPNISTLGTGNRAAKKLSKHGIVLKISKDGAIRLYFKEGENERSIRVR